MRCNALLGSIRVVALAVMVLCSACSAPAPGAAEAQAGTDASTDLAALKLSEACADAAEKFWRRRDYDKPTPPAPGIVENWSYTSHYNTRTKKCYVTTQLFTHLPSGAQSTLEDTSDAAE